MKIWCACVDEYDEEIIEQLSKDYRVNIYEEEIIFCLDYDEIDIIKQYDIEFVDGTQTLFYLFLGDRDNLLDLDLQFEDTLQIYDDNKILFYNNFKKWLKIIEDMFNETLKYIIDNFDECNRNYWDSMLFFAQFNKDQK